VNDRVVESITVVTEMFDTGSAGSYEPAQIIGWVATVLLWRWAVVVFVLMFRARKRI